MVPAAEGARCQHPPPPKPRHLLHSIHHLHSRPAAQLANAPFRPRCRAPAAPHAPSQTGTLQPAPAEKGSLQGQAPCRARPPAGPAAVPWPTLCRVAPEALCPKGRWLGAYVPGLTSTDVTLPPAQEARVPASGQIGPHAVPCPMPCPGPRPCCRRRQVPAEPGGPQQGVGVEERHTAWPAGQVWHDRHGPRSLGVGRLGSVGVGWLAGAGPSPPSKGWGWKNPHRKLKFGMFAQPPTNRRNRLQDRSCGSRSTPRPRP